MGGVKSFLKGLGQDIGGLLRTIIGMLGGKQPRDDEEGIIKAILGKAALANITHKGALVARIGTAIATTR